MSVHSLSSSNFSTYSIYVHCQNSKTSVTINAVYTAINVLFLPLHAAVLCTGLRRRTAASHSDFLAYHMVAVEVSAILGTALYNVGSYLKDMALIMSGVYLFCIIFPGQTSFQCLTCVEHYLAVVRPVTYRRLRDAGGAGIRNVCIGCVWLLCCGWIGVTRLHLPDLPLVPLLSLMGVSAAVVSFCCLSALQALTHPGPGAAAGSGAAAAERVDRSKRRAFHIIAAIAGVLLLKCAALLVCFGAHRLASIGREAACALMDFGLGLTLPSSLVLPLLFLHRAGKLPGQGTV